PTGTAPGVAIPAAPGRPAVLVLPGPPRELRAMWSTALASAPVAAAIAGAVPRRESVIRAYGLSEPDLAATLRTAEDEVPGFERLEITTCMRGGEIEIVTAYDDAAEPAYRELSALLDDAHHATVFSTDGSTIDDLLAQALDGRQIAFAESCTGGQLCSRFVDRAGSSAYVAGGVVSYTNRAKSELLGVPAQLIDALGAVSEPVAAAMAEGALAALHADVAVSTTGVAGPGGGSPEKPVGTVCFGVAMAGRETVTRTVHLTGDRSSVRSVSTTVAMHLLYRELTASPR
ncbi:MAG: nicotinamide-nucleotide amidohydrolase family protein, partial [Gordonia sp. (in: high G+C Gram-positive bacteria)]